MSVAIGICMLLFVLMMVFPFVPGWLEMRQKKDVRHLYINGDFVRNPRYFSTSFKAKLLQAAGSLSSLQATQAVMLSHEEVLVRADQHSKQQEFSQVMCFMEPPALLPESVFKKEVYAKQSIRFPAQTLLRAAACEEDCRLGEKSRVVRWIDAEKQLDIAADCELDLSATAGEKLFLARGCRFRRLYAPLIAIAGGVPVEKPFPQEAGAAVRKVYRDLDHIEAAKTLVGDVIAKGDFMLETDAVLLGNLKVYGKLLLAAGARIHGNVFSEKIVQLAGNNWIYGSVFTQGNVAAGPDCTFGHAGAIESVVARQQIAFSARTIIYGFVLTEGEGSVL